MRVSPTLRRLERAFLPPDLRQNFRPLPKDGQAALREALLRDFFSSPGTPPGYIATSEGRLDLWTHLVGRLDVTRTLVVPWLNSARPLKGAHVLEIGSGTGGGTVALAEQGAQVTGIDVQEHHMRVARRRCELHGVAADFLCVNAADMGRALRGRSFDFVIFSAALEHMTLEERLASLAGAFALLSRDAVCVVLDAPNRLWPFDEHTAWEPFFHWLPDEIAFRSGAHSGRAIFADWCSAKGNGGTELARWGRGVSYHEFDLAIGVGRFEVVSTLEDYWHGSAFRQVGRLWSRACRLLERIENERQAGADSSPPASPAPAVRHRAPKRPVDEQELLPGPDHGVLGRVRSALTARATKAILRSYARPHVHDGFLEPWLQLMLRPVHLDRAHVSAHRSAVTRAERGGTSCSPEGGAHDANQRGIASS